jgi:preprotein translocase subunit SecA
VINIFRGLFGGFNEKELKRIGRIVEQVNGLEPEIRALSDDDLKAQTGRFRDQLANGATLEDILPRAFAVVRETAWRVLGMRHFDVQIMGGVVLHEGNIAEMKTGEGKTLVATLPVYLNALTGKGVHIVTVNDYLARRDSEWMGKVYRFLGLNVGLIVHGLTFAERRAAYQADVVYGTNNEFGFDYLRDNMAMHPDEIVQRPLHYAIVDEVDSILIDEARTPLIISGPGDKSTDLYYKFARLVAGMRPEVDYTIDEQARSVVPTEMGIAKAENMLGVANLYEGEHMDLANYLNQALRAKALMKRDRDYVVKDGQVIIVDEFTGRLMFGRRYSGGLHQAIEAKEGVKIERESQTLATITFQNYFRMYEKLAGMTGTALTEEEEFRKIYGLDVVVIPTNMEMIRQDLPDRVYKTERGKFAAVVEDIAARHATGQPILVGTVSIEKSEQLSALLKKRGIKHQVLNAKYHEKEAEIVAQAGRLGAVTIATNMAGRGTDIMLGGNPEFLARQRWEADGADEDAYPRYLAIAQQETKQEHEQVVALGGLHIVGTERHESRRIDNQLRGRAGRQGDPGSSTFYVSLEDDLMRLFGSDNLKGLMERLGMQDDEAIEHNMVTRAIENAQKRVEARHFDLRKHILNYDDVMNKQREVIYDQRRRVLTGDNLRDLIMEMVADVLAELLDIYCPEKESPEDWNFSGLLENLQVLFLPVDAVTADDLAGFGRAALQEHLFALAERRYAERAEEFGDETMRALERMVLLRVVDQKWMDHLDAMDDLREGIGLRAIGNRDPLIEYKLEAYEMFQAMVQSIREDVVRYIYRVSVVREPERRQAQENRAAAPVASQEPRVGRNAPCPCGSGKKYKKCCGKVS